MIMLKLKTKKIIQKIKNNNNTKMNNKIRNMKNPNYQIMKMTKVNMKMLNRKKE